MARYTGPKTRVSRRYGVPIFGSSKSLERKNYPPGMHGPRGSRRKQSEYAIALGEKQKLRYQYGLLERQFRRIFENALRKRGVTGETLLQLLKRDWITSVYRLGLANTRSAARQLVSHWPCAGETGAREHRFLQCESRRRNHDQGQTEIASARPP
jgi:small subunit ribosomal protein S4